MTKGSWGSGERVGRRAAAWTLLWMGTLALAWPSRATANCAPPQPTLLWSFPANGDVGVATDADLWMSGESLGVPTLDGMPLAANGAGGYELGQLAPNTRYTVKLWVESATPASIVFTTGAGPAGASDLSPASPLVLERDPTDPGACALVPPQGCFDTGPPTRTRFGDGEAPVAWVVTRRGCDGSEHTMLWPAECGPPELLFTGGYACARMAKTDGSTVGPATVLHCSAPDLPPGVSLPVDSSCVGPWPPAEATVVVGNTADGASDQSASGSPVAGGGAPRAEMDSGGCAVGGASAGRQAAGPAWLLLMLSLLRRTRRLSRKTLGRPGLPR